MTDLTFTVISAQEFSPKNVPFFLYGGLYKVSKYYFEVSFSFKVTSYDPEEI